jgi:uncharacterized lipoprotein YehR (DUF1307 family)
MGKGNKKITTLTLLLILCILFIFMTGCTKDGPYKSSSTPKNISENEIYPKGDISNAKVFDTSHNEKAVSLNKEDAEYILQTLKNAKKDLVTEYDSGLVELNITFTDSVIQLVREDDETIYYVFHNNKIDGICYKINSKDLSKLILKASS